MFLFIGMMGDPNVPPGPPPHAMMDPHMYGPQYTQGQFPQPGYQVLY